MRMVWPLPTQASTGDLLPALLPAEASGPAPSAPSVPGPLRRVAAIVSPDFVDAPSAGADHLLSLAELAETGLLQVDILQARFAGADAATEVAAAFAHAARQHERRPYDAILLLGCGAVEPDVGMLHTVLVPCIADAGIPVLTAVGIDDANTMLGDVATQVFADPAALIAHVASRLTQVPIAATEAIGRIRSLTAFLLTELAVESRILLKASIRPALQRHLVAHVDALQRWQQRMIDAKPHLEQRVAREMATLEALRTFVDQQLAHHGERRRERSRLALLRLRLLTVLVYACFVCVMWATVTTQQAVFFSGCALVLVSAVYTALSDRILGDIDAASVQSVQSRAGLDRRTGARPARHGARPLSQASLAPAPAVADAAVYNPSSAARLSPGAPMNDQPNEHVTRAYRDAADENLLLGAILQRLEQSNHLSLDELDAIILQADAAYKARLARLEHTRTLIAGLGTSGETA